MLLLLMRLSPLLVQPRARWASQALVRLPPEMLPPPMPLSPLPLSPLPLPPLQVAPPHLAPAVPEPEARASKGEAGRLLPQSPPPNILFI